VVAVDIRGNRSESEWSAPYAVTLPEPKSIQQSLIAVLPIENLTGTGKAPVKQVRQALLTQLKSAGFTIMEDERLERFMTLHRIRYVGGIDETIAKAFREETGAKAVLVTSLALYSETFPPKIAMFSRLVSTEKKPEILWMDGVGMSGDDSPGILDLGMIDKSQVLQEKAINSLIKSLSGRLSGGIALTDAGKSLKTYKPKETFNSMSLRKGKNYTVAVIPFSNEGRRNHAGEIMALHFIRQLVATDGFTVLEPGVVRSSLLRLRIIMEQGISRNDLYVISNTLTSDLLLTGKTVRYEDPNVPMGTPRVDFSILLMEGMDKKIVWAARSYNQGDDGVFFFDMGRKGTSFELASLMVRSLTTQLDERSSAPTKVLPGGTDFFRRFWGQ
jgi:hypothetical protein